MKKMILNKAIRLKLDELIGQLATGDAKERKAAMMLLEDYEQQQKIPPEALFDLVEENNPNMRMYAIQALGRSGTEEAAEKLLEQLAAYRDTNLVMAETIIEALGVAGQQVAVGPLLNLLGLEKSLPPKEKTWLKRLLPQEKSKKPLSSKDQKYLSLPVIRALEALSSPLLVDALEVFLEDADPLVRWHAIQALLKANLSNYNDSLRQIMERDPADFVREAARLALEKLPPQGN